MGESLGDKTPKPIAPEHPYLTCPDDASQLVCGLGVTRTQITLISLEFTDLSELITPWIRGHTNHILKGVRAFAIRVILGFACPANLE